MPIAPDYFGVFIPVGAPQEVYDTMDKVWAEHVMNAEALKTYASDRGATFDPSYGETARALSMPVVIARNWEFATKSQGTLLFVPVIAVATLVAGKCADGATRAHPSEAARRFGAI